MSRFARTYLERSVARHTRWHVEGERSTGSTIGRGRLPTRRPRLLLQQDGGEERGRRPDGKMRVAWVRERHRESSWYGWRGRACDMGCGWGKAGRSETILFNSSFAACAELKDPKVPRGSSHSDEYSVTNHSMWHGRIDSAKSRTPLPGAVLRDTLAAARAEITVRGIGPRGFAYRGFRVVYVCVGGWCA